MSTYITLIGGEIMKKGINFPKTRNSEGEKKNTMKQNWDVKTYIYIYLARKQKLKHSVNKIL